MCCIGYIVCLTVRPSILSTCPAKASASAFVQALLGSGALLLGSLYIAKGVTEGVWSAGAWATWVWYWGILFLPLTWTPSLRVATSDVRSIFRVLDKPAGVVDGKGTIDGNDAVEIKFGMYLLLFLVSLALSREHQTMSLLRIHIPTRRSRFLPSQVSHLFFQLLPSLPLLVFPALQGRAS